MSIADRERASLADTLQDVGPDRPTLCEGWDSSDLLVHLLIRERRPDGALGMLMSALKEHSDRVRREIRARPWQEQVTLLREGPPRWNPIGWGALDEVANGAELFIHHEDVRRGVPGWEPRDLDAATTDALAGILASRPIRFRLRRSPVGITAIMPGRQALILHAGSPDVQVHGDPAEVLLWVGGRSATRVTLQGDPAAVRAVEALSRRM